MEWYIYLLVVAVGLFAGFINTLAGSGSLLSLPLLMFLGLPANTANGTNRIAILLQNIVGVSSFKKQKLYSFKNELWLTIPAVIGSNVQQQLISLFSFSLVCTEVLYRPVLASFFLQAW